MSRWGLAIIVVACVLLIAGCGGRRLSLDLIEAPAPAEVDVYSRAEADAIIAEMQCKQLARTPVQIARCVNRRGP